MMDWNNNNFGKEWCRLNAEGEIERIDWDEAERLAEMQRSGSRRDDGTAIASLAVAVREYVLRTPTVPIK